MKKTLLGIALMLGVGLNAQTYFSEDFSSGMDSWTNVDSDGDGQSWFAFDAGGSQGNVATSASWTDGVVLTPDNWLISPAIDLSNAVEGVTLTFKVWGQDPEWAFERYSVYIGTTNDVETLLTSGAAYTAIAEADIVTKNLALDDYIGQTIYIAFRHHETSDVFRINIDDIKVAVPAENDLGIKNVKVDKTITGNRTFTVVVENNGLEVASNFDVSLTVDGDTQTQNITNANLSYGNEYNVNFSVFVGSEGSKDVSASILNEDEDMSNNTASGTLTFHPNIIQYVQNDINGNEFNLYNHLSAGKAVILDFMASWCVPCESSTPALSQFIENNGSGQGDVEALAITVEETDNASVMAGLNWNGGFYAYPKFAYSNANYENYYHYSINHDLNEGYIPFFVMICPNVNDPANSEIIKSDIGYVAGMFDPYQTALEQCLGTTDVAVEMPTDFTFKTYPNPAQSSVNVEFNVSAENDVEVSILNTLGQTVLNNNLGKVAGAQSIQLDVSSLEAGMYLVKVKSGNIEKTQMISVM